MRSSYRRSFTSDDANRGNKIRNRENRDSRKKTYAIHHREPYEQASLSQTNDISSLSKPTETPVSRVRTQTTTTSRDRGSSQQSSQSENLPSAQISPILPTFFLLLSPISIQREEKGRDNEARGENSFMRPTYIYEP